MRDSLGRSWQLGTVQLDYNFPERFELTYTGADNAEHRPVMIHRALMGSYERFIGILIEHFAGEFPVWLAPVQAIVLPVADRHIEYAHVGARPSSADFRVEVDDRTESIGRKIREAELRKIPYMLVVGDREVEERTAAVRRHKEGDQGALSLDERACEARGVGGTRGHPCPSGYRFTVDVRVCGCSPVFGRAPRTLSRSAASRLYSAALITRSHTALRS